MTQYLDVSTIKPIADLITDSQEMELQPAQKPTNVEAATSLVASHEGSANSHLVMWRPSEPQFTKAIAEYYRVSRKSVQQWFQKVKEACPWFREADLRLPDDRYTPLCIELMGDYRLSGLPLEAWKAKVWEQNPDLVTAYQASKPPAEPVQTAAPSTAITLRPSETPIAVPQVESLNLSVIDSTQRLTEAIASLNTTLQQFVTNDQTLEAALREQASQKGTRLGTELAITEVGSMVQATEAVRVELAKKLGLLSNPSESPPFPSA
jgi:hypothetical protein